MSRGEGSGTFPPIPADHPLAEAARIVNAYSEEHGLEATVRWLGAGEVGHVAYLGEQRVLRAIVASHFGINLGAGLHGARDAEAISQAAAASPFWSDPETRAFLVAVWLDGCVTGWKAQELASRDGASE